MKIIDINGGLGNQMFQYAFGRSISLHAKQELKLDISNFETYELRTYLLNCFSITGSIATKKELDKYKIQSKYLKYLKYLIKNSHLFKNIKIGKMYFEKQGFSYDPNVFLSHSAYYVGYWQSYKYFENIRDILLKEFSINTMTDTTNLAMLSNIENTSSISLHIRRGDYVTNKHTNSIHGTCSLTYYVNAINIMSQNLDNPTFFIFSDDIQWVKDNLKIEYPTYYVDFNDDSPEKDIILMSKCQHNIIANSSFSWWGAWLNNYSNKIIIAPKNWVNNNNINTIDLIPKDWKRL